MSEWGWKRRLRFAAAATAALCICTLSHSALADFQVRAPTVTWREFEVEHNGAATFGDRRTGQSVTNAIGYGVTPFWQVELEGEWAAAPHGDLSFEATTLENTFQLTEPGRYFADFGFFVEYSRADHDTDASDLTFGPIIRKELPAIFGVRSVHTANAFFSREVGPHHGDDTAFEYAWQSRLYFSPFFQPGFEAYGEIGDIDHPGLVDDQAHRVGPVVTGLWSFAPYGKIRYELGYLFGLTHGAEEGALRWKLEYEISF